MLVHQCSTKINEETKSQQIKGSLVLWWEGKLENLEKKLRESTDSTHHNLRPFEFLILSAGRINKDLSAKSFLLDCSAKTVCFFFFTNSSFLMYRSLYYHTLNKKWSVLWKKKPNLQERDSVASHWKYSLVTEPWVQFLSGTLKIVPVVASPVAKQPLKV